MKKFLVLCAVLFGISGLNFADAMEEQTGISFIYINGSNNLAYNNRLKFKTAFVEDVQKLHPQIKKRFEQDELINEIFLQQKQVFLYLTYQKLLTHFLYQYMYITFL